MPELAEVKLTADYINKHQDIIFRRIGKSAETKVDTNLTIPFDEFTVFAKSRGKELLLELIPVNHNYKTRQLKVTLGMSGAWSFYHINKQPKHVHLFFEDGDGNRLGFEDVRRFGKWSWTGWNPDRGHDPLTEFIEFEKDIVDNYKTNRAFKKPVCEVMMNQKWFNGIGNYLRAEILYRLDVDPFQPMSELTKEKVIELNKLCNTCVSEAYLLGGGQLKDWKNPDGTDPTSFKEWMKCYGKLESIIDGTKRNFWYHPKWKNNDGKEA